MLAFNAQPIGPKSNCPVIPVSKIEELNFKEGW
jgi:hypothetical protein